MADITLSTIVGGGAIIWVDKIISGRQTEASAQTGNVVDIAPSSTQRVILQSALVDATNNNITGMELVVGGRIQIAGTMRNNPSTDGQFCVSNVGGSLAVEETIGMQQEIVGGQGESIILRKPVGNTERGINYDYKIQEPAS